MKKAIGVRIHTKLKANYFDEAVYAAKKPYNFSQEKSIERGVIKDYKQ